MPLSVTQKTGWRSLSVSVAVELLIGCEPAALASEVLVHGPRPHAPIVLEVRVFCFAQARAPPRLKIRACSTSRNDLGSGAGRENPSHIRVEQCLAMHGAYPRPDVGHALASPFAASIRPARGTPYGNLQSNAGLDFIIEQWRPARGPRDNHRPELWCDRPCNRAVWSRLGGGGGGGEPWRALGGYFAMRAFIRRLIGLGTLSSNDSAPMAWALISPDNHGELAPDQCVTAKGYASPQERA